MSIEQLNALYDAYEVALDAEDYTAARVALIKLIARCKISPDIQRSFGQGGQQHIRWRVEDLTGLLAELRRLEAERRSGPYQQVPITYQRAELTGDWS